MGSAILFQQSGTWIITQFIALDGSIRFSGNTNSSTMYWGGCFTNVSHVLQSILSKFVYSRNHTCVNFKLKLCTCAQSHTLGTCTKFKPEILTINVISGIAYFHEIILESMRTLVKQPEVITHMTRPQVHRAVSVCVQTWPQIITA